MANTNTKDPSSLVTSISSSETIINTLTSPTSPIQPIYKVDSLINIAGEPHSGGIFLFEREHHLTYTNRYAYMFYSICIFGCWICTLPSIVATGYARTAAHNKQPFRAKAMFNVAFVFSFFGLVLFVVQAGYLTWTIRYLMHRFLAQ